MKQAFLVALAVSAILTSCRKSAALETEQKSIHVIMRANAGSVIDSIQVDGKTLGPGNAGFPLHAGTADRSMLIPNQNFARSSSLIIYMKLKEGETVRVTDANGKIFEQYISAELMQVLHVMVGQMGNIDPQTGEAEIPDFDTAEAEISFDHVAVGYGSFKPGIEVGKQ